MRVPVSTADGSWSVTHPKANVGSFSQITAKAKKRKLSKKRLCKPGVSEPFLG
jgi:hypothetical protein